MTNLKAGLNATEVQANETHKRMAAKILEYLHRRHPSDKWMVTERFDVPTPYLEVSSLGYVSEMTYELVPLRSMFDAAENLTDEGVDRLKNMIEEFVFWEDTRFLQMHHADLMDLLDAGNDDTDQDICTAERALLNLKGVRTKQRDTVLVWVFKDEIVLRQALIKVGYYIGLMHGKHGRPKSMLGQGEIFPGLATPYEPRQQTWPPAKTTPGSGEPQGPRTTSEPLEPLSESGDYPF